MGELAPIQERADPVARLSAREREVVRYLNS
jgi:hypothetical protein